MEPETEWVWEPLVAVAPVRVWVWAPFVLVPPVFAPGVEIRFVSLPAPPVAVVLVCLEA